MSLRQHNQIRWFTLSLFGSLVVLVGIVLASALLGPDGMEPTAREYAVARVTRSDISRSVNAVGHLLPLRSVEISSQVSGLVTEVYVNVNSSVKKGQLLAQIDSSSFEQHVRQREADLEAARASHALAEINTKRLAGLIEDGIATQQEFDQARAQLQQSKSALLASQAALENARVDLQRCSIRSPIDGTVIFKQIEVGKTVVSSLSAPTLFTISPDLRQMQIIARISEVDIAEIRVGQEAAFTVDAVPNREFRGTLTQIQNPYTPIDQQQQKSAQGDVASFDAAIEFENSDLSLRPGLTASISIIVERRVDVLQIPNAALRVQLNASSADSPEVMQHSDKDAATIFRLPTEDRSAEPMPVVIRLGTTDSFVTEVTDGLKEGDFVVTGIVSNPRAPRRRSLFDFKG